VTSVREGGNFQDITVQPSGTETAPEEVLVILDPVHDEIPDEPPADVPVFLAPPVSPGDKAPVTGAAVTTADKLMEQYKKIGDAQKHTFGAGGPGTPAPNFNLKVPGVNAPPEPGQNAAGQVAAKPPVEAGHREATPPSGASAPARAIPGAQNGGTSSNPAATAPGTHSLQSKPAASKAIEPGSAQPARSTQPKTPATDSGPQF
jgi:rod shape-determining protein MreC